MSKDDKNLDSHWCIASLIQFLSDDVRLCVTITVQIFLTDVATYIEVQGWIYLFIQERYRNILGAWDGLIWRLWLADRQVSFSGMSESELVVGLPECL